VLLGGVLPPKIVGLYVDRSVFWGIFLCPDEFDPALGRKEAILLGFFSLVLLVLLPCRAACSLVERASGEAFTAQKMSQLVSRGHLFISNFKLIILVRLLI
jgi:hypothetical protein